MNSQPSQPTLQQRMVAEAIGTFVLVLFGCGVVHTSILFGAQQGLWQVAIVWGTAIMLVAYSIGGISGAHINPAMTVALAAWRRFPRSDVVAYIGSQLVGAFLAAMMLYFLFAPNLADLERRKGVTRGGPGSEITAMCYGEFYPSPGGLASGDAPYSAAEHGRIKELVPHRIAFLAEVIGTAVLAFVVFALSDPRNSGAPPSHLAPVFIGLTVALLISIIAPLTQACFNPARDFGPRLFTAIAGWGRIAIPIGSDWGWLTVYIVAPIFGAILGGGFYEMVVRPIYCREQESMK